MSALVLRTAPLEEEQLGGTGKVSGVNKFKNHIFEFIDARHRFSKTPLLIWDGLRTG